MRKVDPQAGADVAVKGCPFAGQRARRPDEAQL